MLIGIAKKDDEIIDIASQYYASLFNISADEAKKYIGFSKNAAALESFDELRTVLKKTKSGTQTYIVGYVCWAIPK